MGWQARWPRKGWEGPAACGGVRGPGAILRAGPSTEPPNDPTPSRGAQSALEDGDTPKKRDKLESIDVEGQSISEILQIIRDNMWHKNTISNEI
jgi:hypothetical protein